MENEKEIEKNEKVTEYDGFIPKFREDTPENRRLAAEAMEEAIKLAEKIRKRSEKKQ
ncbi:MAG: hypothetical protein J5865_08730 [Lachnospiraceae bacterium]|nr:hypothetical protein [Lachnospiraceae bacterium]